MAGKFELSRDSAGKFRFRLNAGNGETKANASTAAIADDDLARPD